MWHEVVTKEATAFNAGPLGTTLCRVSVWLDGDTGRLIQTFLGSVFTIGLDDRSRFLL